MKSAPVKPEKDLSVQYPQVSTEIEHMAEVDQAMRTNHVSGEVWDHSIDVHNTERLKGIINEIGWPTKSKVGEKASHQAWLIAQHADHDPDFQMHCLDLLKAERSEEVRSTDIGYLEDRVRVNKGEPQLYGTQFYTNEQGIFEPMPVEDPDNLDARRASLSMGPFQEYVELMQKLYGK